MVIKGGVLKVSISRMGRGVTAKILEQSENLRSSEEGEMHIDSGYWIESCFLPEVCDTGLYIRGTELKHDNRIAKYTFSSEEAAKRWVKEIKKIIDEINGRSNSTQKTDEQLSFNFGGKRAKSKRTRKARC